MAKNYLKETRWLGVSWLVAGYFQEKVGMTIFGRGKMQITDTRDTVLGEKYLAHGA